MIWRLGAVVLALALLQAGEQRVPVEGVIHDAQTGAPISSAQVRLSGTLPGETRPTTLSATSAQDGKFRFMALPAEYTLTAQRDGYFAQTVFGVWQAAFQQKIKVISGQPPPPSTLNLSATGVITGHVLDQTGKPANRVQVAAMQLRYAEGRPTFTAVNSVTTNERGEYRLFWVPPGDYVVAFNPGPAAALSPQILTIGNTPSIQTLTFFPGTTDRSKARTVSLASGEEVQNVDFAIQTVPVATVSGRVDYPFVPSPPSPTGAITGLPNFSLFSQESLTTNLLSLANSNNLPMTLRQQGLFEFRSIAVGTYDLLVTVPAINGQTGQSGQLHFNVGTQGLKDITIAMKPLVELQGKVVAEGIKLPENAIARLLPALTIFPSETPIGANGDFRFTNLSAGTYRLDVTLPDGAFIADLRSNVFQLPTRNNEHVTLSIRGNAGRITGTVSKTDGKIGNDTTVVLVPEKALWENSMLFATSRLDESGKFSLTHVAPGTYKLFAWEGVLNTAWLNADFLSRNEEGGMPISIDAGGVEDVRIMATPLR